MTRTITRLALVPLACLMLASLAREARACSCVEYGTPPCAEYGRADAVFTGVVTGIRKYPGGAPDGMPLALLHFTVEDSYRGVSVAELEVETLSGTSCDTTFKRGERWLVYGYRNESTGRLAIQPCTRTRRLEAAEEDLHYILGLKRAKPRQAVLGRLLRGGYESLAGMRVTVKDGGREYSADTDGEGAYAITLPRPGTYTVRAVVPFSADVSSRTTPVKADPADERTIIEYSVYVPAGQCTYNEINVYAVDLHATAEISGKVTDEAGEPVTRGYVYLIEAVPKDGSKPEREFTSVGADGSFKFEGVAVGRYYLAINPDDEAPGEYDARHPRTFFPGVEDAGEAMPFVVAEGAKIGDVNFKVRPAMKERVITGTVVWADGRTAADASVSLYGGPSGKYIRMVKADAKGRFTMEIYGEFKYEISADAYGEGHGESGRVAVPPDGNPAPIKLVVKPKSD